MFSIFSQYSHLQSFLYTFWRSFFHSFIHPQVALYKLVTSHSFYFFCFIAPKPIFSSLLLLISKHTQTLATFFSLFHFHFRTRSITLELFCLLHLFLKFSLFLSLVKSLLLFLFALNSYRLAKSGVVLRTLAQQQHQQQLH